MRRVEPPIPDARINVSADGLTLNSADATVDQTAGALSPGSMDITAGTYELDGGTITGGTINTTGGRFINASTGTLDGTSTGGITNVEAGLRRDDFTAGFDQ